VVRLTETKFNDVKAEDRGTKFAELAKLAAYKKYIKKAEDDMNDVWNLKEEMKPHCKAIAAAFVEHYRKISDLAEHPDNPDLTPDVYKLQVSETVPAPTDFDDTPTFCRV
jgi:hypothetical protein